MIGQYYTIPRRTTDRTETVTVTVVQPWAPHRTGTHTYSFSLVSLFLLSIDYRGGTLFPKKTFSSPTYHPTFFPFLCLHRIYGTGKPSRHSIPINTTTYYLGTGTQEERVPTYLLPATTCNIRKQQGTPLQLRSQTGK